MRVLYVIFVLCVGALLWAAFAAARHIRRHEVKTADLQEKKSQVSPVASEKEDHEALLSANDTRGD